MTTHRQSPTLKGKVLHPAFDICKAYQKLLEHFGPQGWWPGDSQAEKIAGAVLAQATGWGNAARAVGNLKSEGYLQDSASSLEALLALPVSQLAEIIRPSGYFRQKADRLHRLMAYFHENLGSPPWHIPPSKKVSWRDNLLSLNGLGPETTDSIMLYGFELPFFVVDAYTRRILSRHQMIEGNASYQEIQKLFEKNLPQRSGIYNEYHALLVRVGKEHCRRGACCTGCPLNT